MRTTLEIQNDTRKSDSCWAALRRRVAEACREAARDHAELPELWRDMQRRLALQGIDARPIDLENGLARLAADAHRAGDQAEAQRWHAMKLAARDPNNLDPMPI